MTCCFSTGASALQGSVFKAALACLEEGSPRARASGRMLLLELHTNIMEPARFQGLLDKLHNQSQSRKVKEVIPFQYCSAVIRAMDCETSLTWATFSCFPWLSVVHLACAGLGTP